jgi:ATP-dependent Clp protease protease subunit
MADCTGQPVDKIARDVERDLFMSADQAKDYGIIDGILERRLPTAA